jgi:dienelactone hydrolase
MRTLIVVLIAALLVPAAAGAGLKTAMVEYRQGDAVLEGYLAFDPDLKGKRPGVLVVHEWRGLNEYAMRRAEQLAAMGYVAFAADIYGKGVRAETNKEAAALAGRYRGDRQLLRARVLAALDVLRSREHADPARVAAIGFCFGGTTVLELARSGADVLGVVSFHGGLDTPTPEDAKNIKAKVLAFQGAEDPYVSPAERAAFKKEMTGGGVDWQMVSFGHAVHSFTVPTAGSDPSRGSAYNETADRRSWEMMKLFFAELF